MKYKSKFEERFAAHLESCGISPVYESDTFSYTVPEQKRKYTPDWKLDEHTYVETKGKLTPDDRKKTLLFLEQHPDIKLIFVFMNANNKLRKGAKTTYAMWCEKNGIDWYEKELPADLLSQFMRG